MNIDSILTEWCYRLPNGYPTVAKDYEVLYNVILETAKVTPEYARQIVDRAQGLRNQVITESIQLDSIQNTLLIDAVDAAGKMEQFQKFLNLLPVEADIMTLKYLNTMTYDKATEFAELLYSHTDINEQTINATNYKSGVGFEMFNLEPKGMGRGEIFLAATFQGAQAQGGGQSFDLLSNNRQFEVKDYRIGKSKSIRLGTKGSVTRFKFWDEITITLKRLDQLRGTMENPKFDFHKYFHQKLLDAVAYLDSRREFILAGNLNMKDKMYLDQFYQEANSINSEIQGYTNVILRGPNATPIELSIHPMTKLDNGSIVIKPIDDGSQDITYINAELRRLEYVRNPSKLDVDLQQAVDQIVGEDLQFIVFRRDRVNVTRDFRYVVIDAGKIRIIEKDVIPEDIDSDDDLEII